MSFDPRAIVLINFGQYAKDAEEKRLPDSRLYSLAQLPLLDGFDGFNYIHSYLARPDRTLRTNIVIDDDLASIQEIDNALGKQLGVHVKCEGRYGACGNEARVWTLPYRYEPNADEKIWRGAPER